MASMGDKKLHKMRMDGMAYALRVVEEHGVDQLRQEVKARNAVFVPLDLKTEAVNEIVLDISDRVLNTFKATCMYTLNQQMRFGKKRLNEFWEAFLHNCDMVTAVNPLGGNYEKMSEYAQILKDKYDLEFNLEKIIAVEQANQECHERMANLDYMLELLRSKGFEDAADMLVEYAEG